MKNSNCKPFSEIDSLATVAQVSAAGAEASAVAAQESAVTATVSASGAHNSENMAALYRDQSFGFFTQTQGLYQNFSTRFLGVKTSPPLTDNDGNPLVFGALYYDTGASTFYVWQGAAWSSVFAFNEYTSFISAGTTPRSLVDRYSDTPNVKDFGAVGDGVVDDTAAVQAGITAVSAAGGGKLFFPPGRYLVDSADLIVSKGVILAGDTISIGEVPSGDYSTLTTAVVLNPAYTIRLSDDFTGVIGLAVIKKGLTTPANRSEAEALIASFSGTAITVGNDTFGQASDTIVSHCLILGFSQAYRNNLCERAVVEYVKGDCTNGLLFQNQYDMNRVSNCQFWPFLTARVDTGVDNRAVTYRAGTAYKFETTDNQNFDWPAPAFCFCFGYKVGFSFVGVNSSSLVECSVDGYSYLDYIDDVTYPDDRRQTVGIEFLSRVRPDTAVVGRLLTINGGLYAGQNKGLIINTTSSFFPTVTVVGGSFVSNVSHHIEVVDGRLNLSSGVLKDVEIGPAITVSASNDDGIHVGSGVVFEQVDTRLGAPVTPIHFDSNEALLKSNVDNPHFISGTNNVFVDTYLGEHHVKEDDIAHNTLTKVSPNSSAYNILFRKARGSSSSPAQAEQNDELGKVTFAGYAGGNFVSASYVRALVAGAVGVGGPPTALVFGTAVSGSGLDRVTVDPDGHFLPVTDNAYTCGGALNAWSNIYSRNSLIVTSDARAKTDVQDCFLGLDFIRALHPVSYRFIVGGNKAVRTVHRDADGQEVDEHSPTAVSSEIVVEAAAGERTHWGLIAQEVKAALPEGVDFGGWVLMDKTDPDGDQGLRYEQFIAPLIKAVQELSAKVAALEEAVAAA
jgi:hypothetical protein